MIWYDVSTQYMGFKDDPLYRPEIFETQADPPARWSYGNEFWFDELHGRLMLRPRMLRPHFNSLCISYRYGSTQPVPFAIKRLCSIQVASKILNMDFYSVKVGMGGDISGLKESALKNWKEEAGNIFSAYQRAGAVYAINRS